MTLVTPAAGHVAWLPATEQPPAPSPSAMVATPVSVKV